MTDPTIKDLTPKDLRLICLKLWNIPEDGFRVVDVSVGKLAIYGNGDVYHYGDYDRIIDGQDVWDAIHALAATVDVAFNNQGS